MWECVFFSLYHWFEWYSSDHSFLVYYHSILMWFKPTCCLGTGIPMKIGDSRYCKSRWASLMATWSCHLIQINTAFMFVSVLFLLWSAWCLNNSAVLSWIGEGTSYMLCLWLILLHMSPITVLFRWCVHTTGGTWGYFGISFFFLIIQIY
jgi:hypothetical protein